jgi:fatty acid desaturase
MTLPRRLDLSQLPPSNAYGAWAVARNVVPLVVLLIVAPLLADRSIGAVWALAPFVGLCMYRITIAMHDCTHGTLFASGRLNPCIGLCLAGITGIDFRRFKTQHWKHHRTYGREGDPQGFHYLGVQRFGRARFAWHMLKPLLGANLRYALPESLLHPRNVLRSLRSGDALIAVACQVSMFAIVTGNGRHPWLGLLPLISAATFGLFFSQIRGLAEHGSKTPGAQGGFVRSHSARWLERIFLYDLHFNFHEAHHRWPQVPSRHLPQVHARYLVTQAAFEPSMFATVIAIGAGSSA